MEDTERRRIPAGKIIVKSKSSFVNVFLDGKLLFKGLEPDVRLMINRVPLGMHKLFAESTSENETPTDENETPGESKAWGPEIINLSIASPNFRWILTD